jgi:hypothetical protein
MNYPLYTLRGILYRCEQVRANQNQEGGRVQYVGAVDSRRTELEDMNETGMDKHLLSLLGSPSRSTLVNHKIGEMYSQALQYILQ